MRPNDSLLGAAEKAFAFFVDDDFDHFVNAFQMNFLLQFELKGREIFPIPME